MGLVFSLILLLGLGFRLGHLAEKSLWADEVCTLATVCGTRIDPLARPDFDQPPPGQVWLSATDYRARLLGGERPQTNWGQMLAALRGNVHPPLFFGLMLPWVQGLGMDPATLRTPALVFGLLCLPALVLLVRTTGGTWPMALLAAALFACSGYQVAHAQDARPYTLLTLLAICSATLAWKSIYAGRHRLLYLTAWAGVTLLGVLTQYLFVLFGLWMAAWLLWRHRHKAHEAKVVRRGVIISLATVGLALGVFQWQWGQWQWATQHTAQHYTHGLWSLGGLPELLWRTLADFLAPQAWWGKAVLAAGLAMALFTAWRKRKQFAIPQTLSANEALGRFGGLWVVAMMGGVLLLDVALNSHLLSIRRYTALAAPGLTLWLASVLVAFVAQRRQKWGRRLAALGVMAMLGAMIGVSWQVATGQRFRSDDFKSAARWMVQQGLAAGQPVLVYRSGAVTAGMAYYLPGATQMRGIYNLDATLHQVASWLPQPRPARDVWLVFSHAAPSKRHRLSGVLASAHYQRINIGKFPGVVVERWHRHHP